MKNIVCKVRGDKYNKLFYLHHEYKLIVSYVIIDFCFSNQSSIFVTDMYINSYVNRIPPLYGYCSEF